MAPVLEAPVADQVDSGPPGSTAARGAASRDCAGRGSEPAPEPVRLIEVPEPDQAVFDAEFVALVLTEYPTAEGEGVPARIPPRAGTRSRRVGPRSAAPSDREGPVDSAPATTAGGGRRRPGPWPRSPPGP